MPEKKKVPSSTIAAITALITALGGVGFSWKQNDDQETRAALVQKNMYSVLEYRVSVVEQVCGVNARKMMWGPPHPAPNFMESRRPTFGSDQPSYQDLFDLAQEGKVWQQPKEE